MPRIRRSRGATSVASNSGGIPQDPRPIPSVGRGHPVLAVVGGVEGLGVVEASAGAAGGASAEGGLSIAVAMLIVGGAVLVALLVALVARAGRPAAPPTRRAETPSTDPWREAGRRHDVPAKDDREAFE